jgi:hypothetical protein
VWPEIGDSARPKRSGITRMRFPDKPIHDPVPRLTMEARVLIPSLFETAAY